MDVQRPRDQIVPTSLAQKLKDVQNNFREVKGAATCVVAAQSSRQRLSAVSNLLALLFTGEPARIIARLLICSYYINIVYSRVEAWRPAGLCHALCSVTANSIGSHWHSGCGTAQQDDCTRQQLRTPEALARMRCWQDDTPLAHLVFPYSYVLGLLPVAVLAAAGGGLSWLFAALLLLFTLCNDMWITWGHLKNLLLHGGQPSELLVKQLAMIGCAVMLLAYSIREQPRLRRVTAGLLHTDNETSRPQPGKRRSVLLLLSRLLVGTMLLVMGYHQMLRIKAQAEQARLAASFGDFTPPPTHWGRQDSHDNSWLLLECLLAVPLALGLWTPGVTRLLFVVLLAEAVTQWEWWGGDWPSWHYRQHVREHFYTNAAVAGGLLLMQSFGAGLFTVDSLLAKQD